jgi:hypothetical protein
MRFRLTHFGARVFPTINPSSWGSTSRSRREVERLLNEVVNGVCQSDP